LKSSSGSKIILGEHNIIEEADLKSPIPNYAEIYGVSYKMVHQILERYEEKVKIRAAKI
jgi:hypothetical protein